MTTLLHIDTSINGENSHSRKVTAAFAGAWRTANPTGRHLYRDLAADPVPHMDGSVFSAHQVPAAERTPEQIETLAVSSAIGDQAAAADVIVVGVPMYNFGIPSQLKAWLDHLGVPRFRPNPDSGVGPLSDTKFVFATSRGGSYAPGTPRESFDHQEPYLRSFLNFLAADGDVTFLHTEMALSYVVPQLAEFKNIFDETHAAATAKARELASA